QIGDPKRAILAYGHDDGVSREEAPVVIAPGAGAVRLQVDRAEADPRRELVAGQARWTLVRIGLSRVAVVTVEEVARDLPATVGLRLPGPAKKRMRLAKVVVLLRERGLATLHEDDD